MKIAEIGAVAPGTGRAFDVEGYSIAVFNLDGTLYAGAGKRQLHSTAMTETMRRIVINLASEPSLALREGNSAVRRTGIADAVQSTSAEL